MLSKDWRHQYTLIQGREQGKEGRGREQHSGRAQCQCQNGLHRQPQAALVTSQLFHLSWCCLPQKRLTTGADASAHPLGTQTAADYAGRRVRGRRQRWQAAQWQSATQAPGRCTQAAALSAWWRGSRRAVSTRSSPTLIRYNSHHAT